MAFAFKPPGRRKWYARYTHPVTRKPVTRAGYVDEQATIKLAHRLEVEAARRAEGLLPPEVNWSRRPAAEAVAEWKQAMLDAGGTAKHARLSAGRVAELLAGCGCTRIADLDAARATRWLAEQRATRPNFGATTSNHYVTAARGFARWLVRHRRIDHDPFASVPRVNAHADPRHERRVLSAGDFAGLLASTEAGPAHKRLFDGPHRAALYAVAAGTGLRAEELSIITPESFDFNGKTCIFNVRPGEEKSRRGANLPLRADVAERLRRLCAATPPGRPIWPGAWFKHAARMLRRDLRRAGIPYRDGRGRVFDFAALRAQFVTDLARAGVTLQAAQKLARHGDPRITAKHYTRLEVEDLAAELAKVPPPETEARTPVRTKGVPQDATPRRPLPRSNRHRGSL